MVTLIQSAVLLFSLVSCLWPTGTGNTHVELTPSSVNVCPGSEIVLKCTAKEADRNYTRWKITPESTLYSAVELTLSSTVYYHERFLYEMETKMRAEWTSFSPLCSTFMANASTALDGAVVECSYTPFLMESLTITLRDVPTLHWLNSSSEILRVDNVTVIVEWESNQLSQIDYIVTITPPIENGSPSTITTRQRSHRFTIPYNNTYTITVVGSNCAGESNQLNKRFTFVKCEAPYLGENILEVGELNEPFLKDSHIHLSCSSGHSVINEDDLLITCTCGTDISYKWLPDPLQLQCLRDCGHLPIKNNLYTIINQTNYTIEGSVVEFRCAKIKQIDFTTTTFQTECQSNGQWNPDPKDVCDAEGQERAESNMGKALSVTLGIVFPCVCLIVVGTTVSIMSSIHVARKRKQGRNVIINIELRDRHVVQDHRPQAGIEPQHQESNNEQWGVYSLLQHHDREPSMLRLSHHIYADVGPLQATNVLAVSETSHYSVVQEEAQETKNHQEQIKVDELSHYCEVSQVEDTTTERSTATSDVGSSRSGSISPPPVPPQTELSLRLEDPPFST